MKTKTLLLLGALALGCHLHLNSARAATVFWTGSGDGVSWNSGANWSGGVVPGPANDVVITGGAGTKVILSGGAAVKSIQCTKPFEFSGAYLTVTAGPSLLTGTLNMSATSWISAVNTGTTFTCTGPATMDAAQLYVSDGATLSLPGLRSYRQTYPPTSNGRPPAPAVCWTFPA